MVEFEQIQKHKVILDFIIGKSFSSTAIHLCFRNNYNWNECKSAHLCEG